MKSAIVPALAADPLDHWHLRNPLPVSSILLLAVAHGNGMFLAVGYQPDVAVSADGIHWTREVFWETNRTGFFSGVAFGQGRFVAVDGSTNLWVTVDGRSWSRHGITMEPYANGPGRITYANGLFVAVGSNGLILTSPDAEQWTVRRVNQTTELANVTFGNGLFVAVGSSGMAGQSIFTSPDGNLWTPRDSAGHFNLSAVAFGNGKFVATSSQKVVGGGSSFPLWVLSSSDGIVWSHQDVTSFNTCSAWGSLSFVEGEFVAGGEFASLDCATQVGNVLTSPDGVEWQPRMVGDPDTSVLDLAAAAGQVVAVGATYRSGIPRIALLSSADGHEWTRRDSGIQESLNDVAYGNGQFVAIGHPLTTNGTILTSNDGVAWTQRNWGTAARLRKIAHGNGRFVVVGTDSQRSPATPLVLTSTNGADWDSVSFGITNLPTAVAYGNGIFVVIAAGDTVAASTDGQTWQSSIGPDNGFMSCNAVAAGQGIFVAVGNRIVNGTAYEDRIFTSVDGFRWTRRTAGADISLRSVAFGNGVFVALPVSGSQVLTSSDGIRWNVHSVAFDVEGQSSTRYALAFGNGHFITAGQNGGYITTLIYSSTDGVRWTARNSGTTGFVFGVGAGAGTMLAVGNAGLILQSDVLGAIRSPPRLNAPRWLGTGGLEFTLTAETGERIQIQTSNDLTDWSVVDDFTLGSSPRLWRDASVTNPSSRFYRAVLP